jgi:hypothetical protein
MIHILASNKKNNYSRPCKSLPFKLCIHHPFANPLISSSRLFVSSQPLNLIFSVLETIFIEREKKNSEIIIVLKEISIYKIMLI